MRISDTDVDVFHDITYLLLNEKTSHLLILEPRSPTHSPIRRPFLYQLTSGVGIPSTAQDSFAVLVVCTVTVLGVRIAEAERKSAENV